MFLSEWMVLKLFRHKIKFNNLYLIKHRKRLNSVSVKKYFHIIYIGYREERFYWEFVNTFKKFLIISLNVFLSQVSKSYKGMIAVITIIILIRIQRILKPYILKVNNEVENSSMVAIGFTLYGGLLFMKGQSQVSFIEAFVFILIIVINVVYTSQNKISNYISKF